MSSFKRTDRIAGMLQRALSEIIQHEVKDPKLPHFVTISGVKVSGDLSHAKIYFTALNEDKKQAVQFLNGKAAHIRTLLARAIKLRIVPELHFVYDESIEYGRRLSKLIDEVNPDTNDDSTKS